MRWPLWWQRFTASTTANLFVLMHLFRAVKTGEVWAVETWRDGDLLVYIGAVQIPKGVRYSDTILNVKVKRRVFWRHPDCSTSFPDLGDTLHRGPADRAE